MDKTHDVWMRGLSAAMWFLWHHTFVTHHVDGALASGEVVDLLTGTAQACPITLPYSTDAEWWDG